MVFEDIFAISHGKPLLDFLDAQAASILEVGSNKEILAAIREHKKRYPFPPGIVSIKEDRWTLTFQWKNRTYSMPSSSRLARAKIRMWPKKEKAWAIYQENSDGSNFLLFVDSSWEAREIIRSYMLETIRIQRMERKKRKEEIKREEENRWRKSHVFPIKGSTAPTNPWRTLK